MTFHRDLPSGSAEVLVLALVEERDRHGYDIAKLIGVRSRGALSYHVATMYPLLYRLERRGLVQGRWKEQPGERRRRFYRITPEGRRILRAQRRSWGTFFDVMRRVARIRPA